MDVSYGEKRLLVHNMRDTHIEESLLIVGLNLLSPCLLWMLLHKTEYSLN